MTRIRTTIVLAAALATTVLAPAAADAAVTCKHSPAGLLEVHMSEHNDKTTLGIYPNSSIIGVGSETAPYVDCTGVEPTTANIDTILVVDDSDNPATTRGNDGNTSMGIQDPDKFAPGKTAEGSGLSEIEFIADTKSGDDVLNLSGRANQQITLGTAGAAWISDGTGDAEMAGMPFDRVQLRTGDGPDFLSAQGGADTGAALTATSVQMYSGFGSDVLLGSDSSAGDRLSASDGADTLIGYGGDDLLHPDKGDDQVQGGGGADTVSFDSTTTGVTVDLADAGVQATGQGDDTFSGLENAVGSVRADRLSGDSATNVLNGGPGDDVLDGRGGADEMQGDEGSDTVSYAGAPAGVNVDLAQTSQPTDNDKFFGIENLTGSPFADTLAGNAGPNRISARDGVGDRVTCGGGADSAVTDRRSLDAVDADCDSVDAPAEPAGPAALPVGQGPRPAGRPARDTALSFSLTGAKRQRVLRQRGVRVRVRCPLESCTAVASGAGLRSVRTKVAAGSTRTVTLRLSRRQQAALRRAFAAGKRSRLKVTVTATDAAGNRVTRSLSVSARI